MTTFPGKVTPEQSVERFLAQASAYRPSDEVEVPVATDMTGQLLADLLDEKLSRRAVHDIQSGLKDPNRFDLWIELLQERVACDDPIVLPFGDLCGWKDNWKMHALVFVRDSDELYQEIYPPLAHPEGDWMELREYYCPLSGHLLETEAVPPGYPVLHEYLPDLEGFYSGWLGRELPG